MAKRSRKIDYPPDFEACWKVSTRTGAKSLAYKAWLQAQDDGETVADLHGWCERRNNHRGVVVQRAAGNIQYVEHVSKFINQRFWENEGTLGPAPVKPEELGETMGELRATAVLTMLHRQFGLTSGHENFVSRVSAKPSGVVTMKVTEAFTCNEVRIAFKWTWPEKMSIWYTKDSNCGMTAAGLDAMKSHDSEIDRLLKRWKGAR